MQCTFNDRKQKLKHSKRASDLLILLICQGGSYSKYSFEVERLALREAIDFSSHFLLYMYNRRRLEKISSSI